MNFISMLFNIQKFEDFPIIFLLIYFQFEFLMVREHTGIVSVIPN